MAHDHHRSHDHEPGAHRSRSRRRLAVVLGLVVAYMVAEVVGGLLTNSLALLADAGHMLSDAASLALALFAMWIAQRPPTPQHTYGYYRTEILAALANGATLVAVAIYIFIEAYGRIGEPPDVQGGLMMSIATGGLVVNLAGLWILNAGKGESLNVRGAWLHVLTDALGSVGAVTAGGLIWAFGWYWADPVASVIIGLLVLYSSWSLLKETVAVLMEGAPGHVDVDEVRSGIRSVPGVTGRARPPRLDHHERRDRALGPRRLGWRAHVTRTARGDPGGTARAVRHRPRHHPGRTARLHGARPACVRRHSLSVPGTPSRHRTLSYA